LPYSDCGESEIECYCCGLKGTVTGYVSWDFEYTVNIDGKDYNVTNDRYNLNDYDEAYDLLHGGNKE